MYLKIAQFDQRSARTAYVWDDLPEISDYNRSLRDEIAVYYGIFHGSMRNS